MPKTDGDLVAVSCDECGADGMVRGEDMVCSAFPDDHVMIEGAFAPRPPLTGVAFLNSGGPCQLVDLAALAGEGEPNGDGMVPDDVDGCVESTLGVQTETQWIGDGWTVTRTDHDAATETFRRHLAGVHDITPEDLEASL